MSVRLATGDGRQEVVLDQRKPRATFGRGSVRAPVDLVLGTHKGLSTQAGVVVATDDAWRVVNTSTYSVLGVRDNDGIADILLEPGRAAALDWTSASITILLDNATEYEVKVTADLESRHWPSRCRDTAVRPSARRATRYFDALLVLCEPRLRDAHATEVRSSKEIAAIIRDLGLDRDATEDRIERALERARTHFKLGPHDLHDGRVGRASIRPRLIDVAIRSGTVTRSDLERLEDYAVQPLAS